MNQEELKMFLAAVIPEIIKQTGGGRDGKEEHGGGRRILEEKMFNRLDKFGGEEKFYKEWEYNLRVILKSAHPKFDLFLQGVDKFGDQVTEDTPMLLRRELDKAIQDDVELGEADGRLWEKVGPELFSQLCLLTTGEANLLVRAAPRQDGFVALKRLQERYNGRSPARMLQKLLAIIRPNEVKGIKGIPLAIEAWEGRIKDFMMEYQVDFPDKFKVAILVGMVCKEMQDEVFRDTADLMKEGAYGKVREIMKRISGNRISQDTPQPMDIGAVKEESGYEDSWDEPAQPGEDWTEEAQVQAVSWAQDCYNCGGKGHFARECPSKGKGKGEQKGDHKGKGKGFPTKGQYGNVGPTGYGKGDYGKYGKGDWGKFGGKQGKGEYGKAYPKGNSTIQCYSCGRMGHKSDTCWSSGAKGKGFPTKGQYGNVGPKGYGKGDYGKYGKGDWGKFGGKQGKG